MQSKIMTVMFSMSSGAFYFSEYTNWISALLLFIGVMASTGYFNIDNKKSAK